MTTRPLAHERAPQRARQISLGPLTALALAPPQLMEVAAAAGLDGIGIRLLPAAPGGQCYRLMDDPGLLRDTLAARAATGMRIVDLEMVRIGPAFEVSRFTPFFDTGAQLGAVHVLVAIDDAEPARVTAAFARLCEALAPYGMTADLEFMPWTDAPDLATARRIVQGAAQSNGGILVDALHFARGANRLEEIEALPGQVLHYAQICDGPAAPPATMEALIHAARCERLLPGEGGLDLVSLFKRLPAGLPVCIETPSDTRAPLLGWAEWVRQAAAATRAVLARIDETA